MNSKRIKAEVTITNSSHNNKTCCKAFGVSHIKCKETST